MLDLQKPPTTFLDASGAPHLGAFAGVIPQASLGSARRKKAWRYAGVFRDDLFLGVAIADLGYLGLTFVYVAEGSRIVERAWKSPGALGMRVGPADGTSVALFPGRLATLSSTRAGGITVAIDLPGIRANLDLAGGTTPLTVVSQGDRGAGRTGFTVKQAGLIARGTLQVEDRSYCLDEARGCLDYTEGLFRRQTAWCWATGGGLSVDGRAVGFNLARGVHDDLEGRFTENALWVDGMPAALPPVTFTPGLGSTPWRIHSDDGAVDLVFTPCGERAENVNLLLISSRYRQPFGTFTGHLRDARGRQIRLAGVCGVTEDHAAVW